MTKLADYIKASGRKKTDLANAIGVSRGYVTELCNGSKSPGLKVAALIEDETGGAVTARSWTDQGRGAS
jgi:transcriptional regulator with XRE-family HTH domain